MGMKLLDLIRAAGIDEIRELIASAFESVGDLDRLETRLRDYDKNSESKRQEFQQGIERIISALYGVGVSLPSEDENGSAASLQYVDLVLEKAGKKANSYLTGKDKKRSIEENINRLENIKNGMVMFERQLVSEKDVYENVREEIYFLRNAIIAKVDEIEELINKREKIEAVGGKRKLTLRDESVDSSVAGGSYNMDNAFS